jgi:RNA ligase (TIGR02306 family)
MARNLFSVQKVLDVMPIEGADRIECIKILGYYCVAQKGLYKVGDKLGYLEVDSVTPKWKKLFGDLEQTNWRVKIRKFKKQVSMGYCVPLNKLPNKFRVPASFADLWYARWIYKFLSYLAPYREGEDLTRRFGIKKYEPDNWNQDNGPHARLGGCAKGNFPGFMHKTDETRVQNLGWLVEKYKGQKLYVSQKVDGSSASIFMRDGEFGVCSRNLELNRNDSNAFWQCVNEQGLEEKVKQAAAYLNCNIAFQGELIGPGIQKNKEVLDHLEFRCFNVFNIDTQTYFNFNEFKNICETVGIQTVPIVDDNFTLYHTVDELVEMADGKSLINPKAMREGLVFRPLIETEERKIGRVSFKAVSNKYLLKNES